MPIAGPHNQENALAVTALARPLAAPRRATCARCSRASAACRTAPSSSRERGGVRWYDDSKGTNVGAPPRARSRASPTARSADPRRPGQGRRPRPLRAAGARQGARALVLLGEAAEKIAARSPAPRRSSRRGTLRARRAPRPPRAARPGDVGGCCRRPAPASTSSATTSSAAEQFQRLVRALPAEVECRWLRSSPSTASLFTDRAVAPGRSRAGDGLLGAARRSARRPGRQPASSSSRRPRRWSASPGMALAMHVDYRTLREPALIDALLGLLAGAARRGAARAGAQRAPGAGSSSAAVSFQPSELAKLALVPFLAYQIERKHDRVNSRELLLPTARGAPGCSPA